MTDSNTPSGSFSYPEFTSVRPGKKRKNRNIKTPPSTSHMLARLRDQVRQEEWFTQCSNILESSWNCFSAVKRPVVLCLGLGSPSSSHIARVQLAFLTEACQQLKVNHEDISIYDPVFTTEDHLLFEELNMKVLITTANKNASYPLSIPTICFMPHCDLHLYESLLRSNWNREQLYNIFLVGNHLEAYLENKSKGELESNSPCLLQIAPLLDCRLLPPSETWPTAFNNISVQFLRLQTLSQALVSDDLTSAAHGGHPFPDREKERKKKSCSCLADIPAAIPRGFEIRIYYYKVFNIFLAPFFFFSVRLTASVQDNCPWRWKSAAKWALHVEKVY